jgi:hypothetical protein
MALNGSGSCSIKEVKKLSHWAWSYYETKNEKKRYLQWRRLKKP